MVGCATPAMHKNNVEMSKSFFIKKYLETI